MKKDKGVAITIEQQDMNRGYDEVAAEGQAADEKMFMEMQPRGRFTASGLNALVAATNEMLPLLDQEPTYPTFDDGEYGELPVDFTRILYMFSQASQDAVEADIVDPSVGFAIENVTDDTDLTLLAGKISKLANDKNFKRFLSEEVEDEGEEEEPVAEVSDDSMSDEDMDSLFMSRMG